MVTGEEGKVNTELCEKCDNEGNRDTGIINEVKFRIYGIYSVHVLYVRQ